MIRAATASAVVLAGLFAARPPVSSGPRNALPVAIHNDNLRSAGTLSRGVLKVSLELSEVTWRPLGPERAGTDVYAFAEAGKPAELPGPMIRVPLGTAVRATVTNRLDVAVQVHGLASRHAIHMDSLLLQPGESRAVRFTADAEGTFFYWAGKVGTAFNDRNFKDAGLNGALIVDSPGGSTNDRVFLIHQFYGGADSAGAPEGAQEILVINGRPWPLTERFTYEVGDSVRWRWINAADNTHPLHLHGFYYRVEARGDVARDTVYWPQQQRMVVTEMLGTAQTMRMTWSPDRPGGWIFHCHLTFHIIANPALGAEKLSNKQRREQVFGVHEVHEPAHHVERAMGGLMLGMYVKPRGALPVEAGDRRMLRLFVHSGRLPGDTTRRFGYVLQQGAEPAPDSLSPWAPAIVLHRGEPTTIRVINRSTQATAVHWHGLEIDSPFDGVVGVGGYAGSPAPPIMPGDSFDVRVKPPRSGSFMYHTHVNELVQQGGGLWGPLLVLEPGQPWDREHDLIFQAGTRPDLNPWLNGRTRHDTLTLKAGVPYRFRLMNVTMVNPAIQFWLVRDGAPVLWTPLARDGFDLPAWQRDPARARLHVGIGETKDVEVRFPRPGNHTLEMRGGGGGLMTSQAIRVVQ